MLRKLLNLQDSAQAPASASPIALEHFPNRPLQSVAEAHAKRWPFPPHLDNPNTPWLQALKGLYAQPITFPASLSPEAGQLLHALVLNTQPRVVLETGMFLGISTLWIASALELIGAGVLHSIDDFRPIRKGIWREQEMLEGREARVRQTLAAARLDHRVTIHNANSAIGVHNVVAELKSTHQSVQLAFLDADHSPEGVRAEFDALEPALDTGGVLVLHDTFPEICNWKGPRALIDHLRTSTRGRYECLDMYLAPTNFGLGILRRVG